MPWIGGFTFAESPDRDCLSARIIWHADHDPMTLRVEAEPGSPADPDCLVIDRIEPWLTVVGTASGREHAVLSDGKHHIRLDVIGGKIRGEKAVRLRFHFDGLRQANAGLLPLHRLLALHRNRRFGKMLYPRDPAVGRAAQLLRVHDAIADGASLRDIAMALTGADRSSAGWSRVSDSQRSRVRRLARQAREMACGGYRDLLRGK